MYDIYEKLGFRYYKTRDGMLYVSNLDEMIAEHGLEVVEACIDACELYNSVMKENQK